MMHTYKKSEMVYTDYRWTAKADHDNPKFIYGSDHSELNRTEGYEMLYFINSLAHTWNWNDVGVSSYQLLEKIIRNEVPPFIRTHAGIKHWIQDRYREIFNDSFIVFE